jgi:muramoyltetrapeptide carboxypeptidase
MQSAIEFLKAGDTIGIMCPAGAVTAEKMEAMYRQLRQWGYNIKVGKTVGSSYFKYSATDAERLKDLQQMLDDTSIKAILFGRGGYGCVRIIDDLDFTQFNKKPKWLLGYSDITCLHGHIHSNYNIPTIHGQMSGGYQASDWHQDSIDSIHQVLSGEKIKYAVAGHAMNRLGQAEGILVGGNLALISDLIGTKSDIDTKGKILFIEEIGEYAYNIDRMMWQLLRAGKLDQLAGLLVGGFTDTQDNETPFGKTEKEIVWEKVKDFKYPVAFDFPVGHQAENLALKIGVSYQLKVNASVKLEEL